MEGRGPLKSLGDGFEDVQPMVLVGDDGNGNDVVVGEGSM
jgi:hypothetical protein